MYYIFLFSNKYYNIKLINKIIEIKFPGFLLFNLIYIISTPINLNSFNKKYIIHNINYTNILNNIFNSKIILNNTLSI